MRIRLTSPEVSLRPRLHFARLAKSYGLENGVRSPSTKSAADVRLC
jgi:hypothetical protein